MIDSLDEQLIELLRQDAYQSSTALAKYLNVSSATVRRRIKRLIQKGVIHIVAVAEPAKIGLPLRAIMAFDVQHEDIKSCLEQLKEKEEIKWLSVTTGRYDIIAIGWFRSTEEIYRFIEMEIPRLKEIRDSETFICLDVAKKH